MKLFTWDNIIKGEPKNTIWALNKSLYDPKNKHIDSGTKDFILLIRNLAKFSFKRSQYHTCLCYKGNEGKNS